MTRRCSHCSHDGHNSRTCLNRGVKLFGVRLTDGSIRKSASMGNLSHYPGSSVHSGTMSSCSPRIGGSPGETLDHAAADGYASEDFVPGSSSCRERKKGVPWTEDEHRMFLLGLQKLGKGDWRGISRNYVVSRTPTQVASHAQKYFIRKSNTLRKKRRSSLFDIVADEPSSIPVNRTAPEGQTGSPFPPPPPPAASSATAGEDGETMNSNNGDTHYTPNDPVPSCYPVLYPAYFPPFLPFALPYWPGHYAKPATRVVKPTAVHSGVPFNVDELIGISKLSLREKVGEDGPFSLSLKQVDGSSRQSAFHANTTSGNSGRNPIHAV